MQEIVPFMIFFYTYDFFLFVCECPWEGAFYFWSISLGTDKCLLMGDGLFEQHKHSLNGTDTAPFLEAGHCQGTRANKCRIGE